MEPKIETKDKEIKKESFSGPASYPISSWVSGGEQAAAGSAGERQAAAGSAGERQASLTEPQCTQFTM